MDQTLQTILFVIIVLLVLLAVTAPRRKNGGCPYSCNCPMCSKKYIFKGDNNLYLGDNGFFKYGKNDCRTHWRILPVGLGKVALLSIYSGNFLSKCKDPCTENPQSLSASIKPCDIRCNTDGHFTMLDNRNGTVGLVTSNGQYLSRCAACGPDNQDKLVSTPSPNPSGIFTLEKAN